MDDIKQPAIRPQASGYSEAGASVTRRAMKGFLARSLSAIQDIDYNNFTMRQRGRMLYMASPIATGAINTNRTKVVGTGLTLKSAVDRDRLGLTEEAAKAWQRQTEREFAIWAGKKEHCDAQGVSNLAGLQQLAVKAWLMSGDVFALIKRYKPVVTSPYGLRIHMIEADRVSTPTKYGAAVTGRMTEGKNDETGNKIFDGVEVDGEGKIVAYHVCTGYPGVYSPEPLEWKRVEAFGKKTGLPNILQVMDPERPGQYRGLTYLAQVIEPLLQVNRYTQAEMLAALVQSFYTAWIKTNAGTTENPLEETGTGNEDGLGEEPEKVSRSHKDYEMGPGTVTVLEPGEEVTFGNPNVPTAGFEKFVKAIALQIGTALEIPVDVLLKQFNASYSASRGALMEAWEAFRMRRKWLVDDFCQPIYEIWLTEAVALGRIKAPGFFDDPGIRAAWCGAYWIGPVQGHLDPKKEVEADILAVDRAFKTHEQVTREYGNGDWEENAEQVGRENAVLAAAGGGKVMTITASPEPKEDEDEKKGGGGEDE